MRINRTNLVSTIGSLVLLAALALLPGAEDEHVELLAVHVGDGELDAGAGLGDAVERGRDVLVARGVVVARLGVELPLGVDHAAPDGPE